jgi:hypothetical protein
MAHFVAFPGRPREKSWPKTGYGADFGPKAGESPA